MKAMIIATTLVSLLAVAFAADVVEGALGDCPVMGASGDAVTWDYGVYSGKGPLHWSELFPTCQGTKQSPVDFPIDVKYAPREFGPKPMISKANFTAGGSHQNFALSCADAGTCGFTTVNGTKYTVVNVHNHAPSEHTLGGKRYDMETHIVHANAAGNKFIVLAIMGQLPPNSTYPAIEYERAAKKEYGLNPMFQAELDHANTGQVFELAFGSMVHPDVGFCAYEGSLTTPPCTEAVTFYMSMHVETVTRRQIHRYLRMAGADVEGNARPLQPLNGRNVTCYLV